MFKAVCVCRSSFDCSLPEKCEAWLVEEGRKYINWTRVDQNLHLMDYVTGKIIKEK